MPLTHAGRQKRYREAHESDPAAKNRLAAQKRVLRVANKTRDSAAKKEYERGLQNSGDITFVTSFTPVFILLGYTRSVPDKNLIKVV